MLLLIKVSDDSIENTYEVHFYIFLLKLYRDESVYEMQMSEKNYDDS